MRLTRNSIVQIQQKLKQLGFNPGPIDGIRGVRTDAAIVAFKKQVGLRARPFIGPITWGKLFDGPVDKFTGVGKRPSIESPDMPWFDEAHRMKGLHEDRDEKTLRAWFAKSVRWIDPGDIPWCGAFVESCIAKTLPREPRISNPLGARNWGKFGIACKPQKGAILTFWRGKRSGWSGHVGFYNSEDSSAYHVLGGNQSNAVTITRVSKSRFLTARWPATAMAPSGSAVAGDIGGDLSTNEA